MHRAALVALALALAAPPAARAQDDEWGITRDDEPRPRTGRTGRGSRAGASRGEPEGAPSATPDDAALRERYLRIVLSDPRDGFAMDRLLGLYRARDGSLAGLEEEMLARLVPAPDERGALMVLARIARESGRLDDARARYSEVLSAHEGDSLALRALAAVALSSGAPEEAREHLRGALLGAEEADRDEVARALGEVLFALEDWDGVEALYEDLASGSRGAFLRTELARELGAHGEHERAIAALDRAASALGGDRRALPPVLVLRARSEIALGRLEDASATLARARSLTSATAGVRGEIAELILEAHRRADRLAALVDTLAEHGSGFIDRMTLARALDELGRDDEAADAYLRAAALAPRDPEPRTRALRVLLRAGRLEDALEVARSRARALPRDARFVTEFAELVASAGERAPALAVLDDAARRAPREVPLLQALAEIYVRWDEPERAERVLERLVELEPDDATHRVALGDHRLSQGDREGALRAFREVLDATPDAAAGHALLGGIYADHDLLTEAVSELEAAAALEPASLEHARELARVLERAGEDRRAEEAWERVLSLATSETSADALSAREAREHVVGLWSRARSAASHVAELRALFEGAEPDLEAGRFLAEVLRRRAQIPEAIAVLARVAELAPADVPSLLLLERLEVQEDDRAGAIETLRALAEADRANAAQYYLRMSEHAAALYRDDEALAYVRRATELAPDGAAAFGRLGALLRARGELGEARRALGRARELDERDDETALALAELEIEAGAGARALEVLRSVIEESPDDEAVARAARLSGALGDPALVTVRDALLTASLDAPGRVAVRRLLVDAWSRSTASLRALVLADQAGEADRVELRRLVTRALGPILSALWEGSEPERRAALALLGPAEVAAAVPALLSLAADEGPIDLRHEALVGAGRAATSAHLARLSALAGEGTDLTLRIDALWALGRLGEPAHARLLEGLVAREPALRGMAALGLARSLRELSARARAALAAALARALEAEDHPGAAGCIALALARAAPHRVAPYLAATDRLTGADENVRALMAVALASTDDPVAHAALARAVARGSAREAIFGALRRPAADPLASAPRRGEPVAAYAMRSLGLAPVGSLDLSAHELALVDAFARALGSEETEAASALTALAPASGGWSWPAARTPGDLTAPRLEASLVAALAPLVARWAQLGTGEVRTRALALSAASGAAEATDVVVEVLDGDSAALSRVVLEALDAGGAPPVRDAVVRALAGSDDWGVRALAARALAGVEAAGAVTALAAAVEHDPYAVVRDAAVGALAPLVPASSLAISALCLAQASDEEPAVRARATAALGGAPCAP